MISILSILVIAGIGAVFYYTNNAEGTILGPGTGNECEPGWFTPTNPDTSEPYTSTDTLREDVVAASPEWNETQVNDYMSHAELRDTENGTIVQLQEVCQ